MTSPSPAVGTPEKRSRPELGASRWSRRVPVILLSLAGLTVAVILTLFQTDVLDSVWEPFFGDGSRQVLTSSLSKALPVPDASLGAVAYAVEAILESIGGPRRARDTPWVVLAAGLVAAGLGLAALGLIAVQALVVGSFCTLCLTSAAISLLVAVLVASEVRVAVREVRSRRSHS
jgi:uncharacterized membrane protein